MKLKGLALTLPVCDLRPLVDEKSRRALSPSLAECGKTHIIGFGAARERKLNIPWRDEQDTVYFDCTGAISLPVYLPDGESVDRAVRRVYLDSDALVRFEFILFAPPKHHYSEYYNRADEFARSFWQDRVIIKQHRSNSEVTFSTAIPLLVKKFTAMTTPEFRNARIRSDLVSELEPQIQVIGEVEDDEHEALNPQHVFAENQISVAFRSIKMKGRAAPIDTVYITYPPGLFTRPRYDDYLPLSHIRAHLAWLHSDLEVLMHILKRCTANDDPIETKVANYVIKLATGLRRVPSVGHPQERILVELVGVLEKFHQRRISRILARLKNSTLPTPIKEEITHILGTYLSSAEPDDKNKQTDDKTALCFSLMKQLEELPEGRDSASDYHNLMVSAVETIFCHELGNPIKEQEIHDGRKRVDIVFNNASHGGFFHDLTVKYKILCPYVFFECKNYSGDLKNPEVDQLIARLSEKRGIFGAVLCRRLNDKQTVQKRCQDAIHHNGRYILVLDDADIKNLLQLRAKDDSEGVNQYMESSFRKLLM